MNIITLKRIDESNFIPCFNLELAAGQERFVSHPVRSLAQAYVYYHQCTPLGIYYGNLMVGYAMVLYDHDEKTYNIWHMMIDKHHQHKGYGKLALYCILDYIRRCPFGPSHTVLLTCSPENHTALQLYRNFGFSETGRCDEDEVELALTLS